MDFHYNGPHPVARPDEREIGRWVTIAGCMFTIGEDGLPLPSTDWTGRFVKLFYGAVEALLTDRRLLILVRNGETIVGNVGDDSRSVLLVSLPLAEISTMSVVSKRRFLGGVKEAHLNITCMTSAVVHLRLDPIVAEPGRGPMGYQRYRGTLRDVLEAFVEPVVVARRPAASAEQAQRLDRVAAGHRNIGDGEVTAEF